MSLHELESALTADGVEPLRAVARALLEQNRQLEHALQSRILIEQAKGILAERFSLEPDSAFELLRRAARNHRLRVHDLAERVITEPETPAEILGLRR